MLRRHAAKSPATIGANATAFENREGWGSLSGAAYVVKAATKEARLGQLALRNL